MRDNSRTSLQENEASFENGALRIAVPGAQKARPKRITVTVSGAEKTAQIVEHAAVATA